MSKVLVSEFYMHGMDKPKRRYAIKGGTIPPFTMELNGNRYIMPGWYKLKPDEATPDIKDIAYYPYKAPKPNIPDIDSNKVYKVKSSKGDKEYLVQMNNSGSMECTCPGYQFRRSCRHIKTVLQP
jgi:hypothetical protein